jgi:hypothetical protein
MSENLELHSLAGHSYFLDVDASNGGFPTQLAMMV